MQKMNLPDHSAKYAALKNRGLLAVTGPDAHEFLQGMVTCDMAGLSEDKALFAAHLTHQGRMVDVFFIYMLSGNIVLECTKDRLMPLAKSLHSYKMRYNIEFEDLTGDYDVFAAPASKVAEAGVSMAHKGGIAFADSRHKAMGLRLVLPQGHTQQAELAETAYETHRLKLSIPADDDFTREKTISGEYCLEYLNGVNYEKGCYIGQEMTARTHFRNAPKKRMVSITYENDAPAFGTDVLAGKLKVGTLFTAQGGHSIAIVRIAKALAPNAQLTAGGIPLVAHKPAWANYDIES